MLKATVVAATLIALGLWLAFDADEAPRAVDDPSENLDVVAALPASVEAIAPPAELKTETAVAPVSVAAPAETRLPVSADDPCPCAYAWHKRRAARAQAARESEPKDLNWAYETEQLMTQFMRDNFDEGFDLTSVACRTSHCEVLATGPADSFNQIENVVRSAIAEPWSTFSGNLSAAMLDTSGSRATVRAYLRRAAPAGARSRHWPLPALAPDDQPCDCATREWQQRRQELRDEALAAEGKDGVWAYATQQELAQFIAADPRSVTFEITSIDCRTTYCTVQAIGRVHEAMDAFPDIVRNAASKLTGIAPEVGTSSSTSEDLIELGAEFRRAAGSAEWVER